MQGVWGKLGLGYGKSGILGSGTAWTMGVQGDWDRGGGVCVVGVCGLGYRGEGDRGSGGQGDEVMSGSEGTP